MAECSTTSVCRTYPLVENTHCNQRSTQRDTNISREALDLLKLGNSWEQTENKIEVLKSKLRTKENLNTSTIQ